MSTEEIVAGVFVGLLAFGGLIVVVSAVMIANEDRHPTVLRIRNWYRKTQGLPLVEEWWKR